MVTHEICLFPGQGAQYPGMGKDLYERSGAVRDLFAEASDIAGREMTDLLFSGSEEDLKATENTQFAVTLVNIAVHTYLHEQGILPPASAERIFAGFSLGEISAYHAAGILNRSDLFRLIRIRSAAMAKAGARAAAQFGELGMAAVLGIGFDTVVQTIASSGIEQVYAANDNSPTQVVIAGVTAGIDALMPALKAAGARRVIPLKVSGPFHTPLMGETAVEFAQALEEFSFANPQAVVFANVTGDRIRTGSEARELCGRQLVSPVRWTRIMHHIVDAAAAEPQPEDGQPWPLCIESGPGTVLSGLWRGSGLSGVCKPAGTGEAIAAL